MGVSDPHTAAEALSQSTMINDRVTRHQGSSPTPILASIDQLAKATVAVSHQLTLLNGEVNQNARGLKEPHYKIHDRLLVKKPASF